MTRGPAYQGQRRAIGLVEDHFAVTMGLAALLQRTPDLTLVVHARTVIELLHRAPRLDLVLLDLSLADGSMPEDNVTTLAERGIPALAYTSGDNAYFIRSAARGGIRGIVRKTATQDELLRAIRGSLRNDPVVLTTDWAAAIDADPVIGAVDLSARQREVLELFACGMSARDVGEATGLSVTTVHDYLLRIRAKYAQQGRGAATKLDLYQRAVEDGVLPPPSVTPAPPGHGERRSRNRGGE